MEVDFYQPQIFSMDKRMTCLHLLTCTEMKNGKFDLFSISSILNVLMFQDK